MACARGSLPSARCRTTAASAETRCAAAAAASPATATTEMANSAGPGAGPVRQRRAEGLRSCASPRFDRLHVALARHHAGMQEQQQFGGRSGGSMGREQPIQLAGLIANLVAMQRHAGNVVTGPCLRAARDDNVAAL